MILLGHRDRSSQSEERFVAGFAMRFMGVLLTIQASQGGNSHQNAAKCRAEKISCANISRRPRVERHSPAKCPYSRVWENAAREHCGKHLALVNLTEGSAESKDICIRLQSAIFMRSAAGCITATGTAGVFHTVHEWIFATCLTEQTILVGLIVSWLSAITFKITQS